MKNASTNSMVQILSIRDFVLLWIAGSISVLGSQFSLIAMPWLVLQLTGDPLALGMVLALGGIPRAVFIPLGGAITDRFSPRIILLICDWLNFVLAALAAVLVYFGIMQVWMIYLFSLTTGLLAGFVMPASTSILPTLVPEADLQVGNSITMGSSQLAGFIGPALAGIVIGIYSHSNFGIAIAFAVDALSFVLSALALTLMSAGRRLQGTDAVVQAGEAIWSSIHEAFGYLWSHPGMQVRFIFMAAVTLFFRGPLLVGIPVLADQRLPEGARAFGLLMSALAGGNLLGFILAGALPKPGGRALSIIFIVLLVAFGVVLVSLGWITLTWIDFVLILMLSVGNGYIVISIITWIQQRTPREMLGRIMGMLMLATIGLVPLSQALSGAVIRWNLTGLFVLGGGLVLLTALWVAFQPAFKALSSEMSGDLGFEEIV